MLGDGVVSLRRMSLADAETQLAGEDEEHVRWINMGHASTLETVRAWIERGQAGWDAGGPVFSFGIVGPEGGLVGMIEANLDHTRISGIREGEANVSYSLYPMARGKGYVTRALRLMEAFLAGRGVTAAVIRLNPENVRSARVAERGGYRRDGWAHRADGQVWAVYRKPLQLPGSRPSEHSC